MKKKNKFIFSLLFLFFTVHGYGQDNQYLLNGKIDPRFKGKKVMLFAFNDDVILRVDTAEILDGAFTFTGRESLKDISILTIGNYPDTVISQIVILDRGNIVMDMDKGRVYGTFLNNLYQAYLDTMAVFGRELEAVAEESEIPNKVITGSLRHEKLIEMGRYTVNFKKQNINNIVGQYFFEKETGKSFAESFAFPPSRSCPDSAFHIIYNAANDDYKQKKWIQEYLELLNNKTKLSEQQKQQIKKHFHDFVLTDLSGNSRKISDFIGTSRYILLDFWASWCGPCITAFPELKKTYMKYDRQYFEIIGISLDTNEKAWKNMLEKVDIPWPQLIGGTHEMEKEIMEAYSFNGIPFAILLDQDGTIISSGHALEITQKLYEFID